MNLSLLFALQHKNANKAKENKSKRKYFLLHVYLKTMKQHCMHINLALS